MRGLGRFERRWLKAVQPQRHRAGQSSDFQQQRENHAAEREKPGLGFKAQTRRGRPDRWADVGKKLPPGRRPLNQQLGSVVHAANSSGGFACTISIWSPITVAVLWITPEGNSNTEAACRWTGANLHGFTPA